MVWLHDGKNVTICSAVSTEYRRVTEQTDGQTDGQTDRQTDRHVATA